MLFRYERRRRPRRTDEVEAKALNRGLSRNRSSEGVSSYRSSVGGVSTCAPMNLVAPDRGRKSHKRVDRLAFRTR